VTEPRRLAGRYLRQNPRFALLFAQQLLVDRGRRLRRTPTLRGSGGRTTT
jgi:hypothetical protein